MQRLILRHVRGSGGLRFAADENADKAHHDADEERIEINWECHAAERRIGLRNHAAEEAQQHATERSALAHVLRPDAHERHDAPGGGNHGKAGESTLLSN